jgi:rhodanese-related sulfurtransferase
MTAVSGRASYESAHIQGARFVDHQADLSDTSSGFNYTLLPPDRLQSALRKLGIDNDSTVVVYSTSHTMWATRLWWILRSCGFEDIHVLDGGFQAGQSGTSVPIWQRELRYRQPRYPLLDSPLGRQAGSRSRHRSGLGVHDQRSRRREG